MTKKQSTKKGGSKGKARRTVEDRARAIVADAKGYDSDTRKSIKYMLDTGDEDLADFVERAEAGETICDLIRIDEEQATAARAVIALFDLPGLPDFISEALYMILGTAARLRNIGIATGEGDEAGFDVKALADLFTVTTGFQRDLTFEPAADVAELISRVVKHPDLSTKMRYEFGCVVTEELMNGVDTDSPGVIRALLAEYEKQHKIV
jgi:hypothetical protein